MPLKKDQKMTNRSFLNYRPCRLGNLAKFQPESNPYNASLVNLLLCHKAESPEWGKPQATVPQATLSRWEWREIYWKSRKTFWQRTSQHNREIAAVMKEVATEDYSPVVRAELINFRQVAELRQKQPSTESVWTRTEKSLFISVNSTWNSASSSIMDVGNKLLGL